MVTSTDEALSLKIDGNNLFRNGEYRKALHKFAMALERLPPSADLHERSTLLCNRAIAYNKLKLFIEAEHEATEAIQLNPANVKAYYHRMMSRRSLSDINGFKNDFEKVLLLKENGEDRPDLGYLNCIDAAIVQALTTLAADEDLMLIAAGWWKNLRSFYNGAGEHPGPIHNLVLIGRDKNADLAYNNDEREPMHNENDDSDSHRSKLDDSVNDACAFAGKDAPVCKRLPPFDDNIVLLAGLQKDVDYVVVPDNVWSFLFQQFGGDRAIRRPILIEPQVDGPAVVDVVLHPVSITVQRVDRAPDAPRKIVLVCSPLKTVLDAIRAVCTICKATLSEIRPVKPSGVVFDAVWPKLRLCDTGIADGLTMFVERRTTNGIWSCSKSVSTTTPGEVETCCACLDRIPPLPPTLVSETCNQARYCSSRCKQSHSRWHERFDHGPEKAGGRAHLPGATGLVNIGNSCYINAALQCLSGTHELTRVFLSNDFVQELNRDNPLGCKGRLAEAYADLLKDMWFSNAPYADPREFKRAVSCFASQFAGCQQQDAQEFLAFLLDGIHEDLNRIRQKPYVPATDSNGRPDEIVAMEQWTNYLARDQSIVVDCLLGQFKSEVVCAANPDCPPSATFDPFMCVSLPLPEPVRIVPVVYYPVSGQVPTQLLIKVDRVSILSMEVALLAVLSERHDYSPGNQLIFAQVAHSRPLTFLPKNNQSIELSASQELGVFEIRPRCIPVSCIIRQIPVTGKESAVLFRGRPFVVDFCIDECPRLSGQQVYRRIIEFLARGLYKPNVEPSFWIEMFSSHERTEIRKTDDPVDFHYFTRPILVIVYKTDDFLDELDMNELMRVDQSGEGLVEPAIGSTSIYDCFKAFTKMESLGVDDWTCASCHKKGNASKRMSFWRLPDVLILHLKRFDSVRRHALFGEAANKISKEVQFPLKDLDLSAFVSNKQVEQPMPLYELFGVINHFGASFFGHYTAFTKGLDGVWRHFDDDTVKVVSPDEICQSSAYLLFYRRQSD